MKRPEGKLIKCLNTGTKLLKIQCFDLALITVSNHDTSDLTSLCHHVCGEN